MQLNIDDKTMKWDENKKVKVKKMQTAKRAITSIVYSFLGIRILRLKNSDFNLRILRKTSEWRILKLM